MRHGKKDNHLGRTHSHREAMLSNMASSLILKKRIETTLAKAKELRKFVEPLLTKAKDDTHQNRRIVFQTLTSKETIKELFGPVADKIASRPGGYTRIIKLGNRPGDNAETCLIELVDFNETLLAAAQEKAAARTRRGRRSSGARQAADTAAIPAAEVVADEPVAAEEAPVAEAAVEEAPVAEAPAATEGEAPAEESNDEPKQA
ncbi:50S ribosomal protein L17 [Rudanella paleaurantiibacter]|uniref:Large ribosomal subunit protein bL17 n=1 Tax=Rudanella paleaurantiibacter TaxID=2614655 RepID=A0A7J5TX39_9BACT|nr:50S ribosomal protein L17 [Rudanella paleaurantiibacter]KAB7729204.1 50S ribosomal protein L17 [Rudanella paleaurantiibacter]